MAEPTNLPRMDNPPVEYQPGLVFDMGIWLGTFQESFNQAMSQLESLLTVVTVNIGGSGAGPINVSVPGLNPNSLLSYSLISSTNVVTISSVVIGTNQFSVTFSGDPGVSAIISYIPFYANP